MPETICYTDRVLSDSAYQRSSGASISVDETVPRVGLFPGLARSRASKLGQCRCIRDDGVLLRGSVVF